MMSKPTKKKGLKLSPSSLNLYLECARCFWLRFNQGLRRPEGAVSSLPAGADYTLKAHYDSIRKKGLPPELQGQVPGWLWPDEAKVKEMRKNSFGFALTQEVWFGGAFDEALELADGSIIPLDNKTRGFPPKEAHWTHKAQMSGYTLILQEKGIKTRPLAYLVHWFFDHKNIKPVNPLGLNVAVEQIKTNPGEIREKILEAVKVLKGSLPKAGQRSGPNANETCPFCWYRQVK